jgi:hypothetical protein
MTKTENSPPKEKANIIINAELWRKMRMWAITHNMSFFEAANHALKTFLAEQDDLK